MWLHNDLNDPNNEIYQLSLHLVLQHFMQSNQQKIDWARASPESGESLAKVSRFFNE